MIDWVELDQFQVVVERVWRQLVGETGLTAETLGGNNIPWGKELISVCRKSLGTRLDYIPCKVCGRAVIIYYSLLANANALP